MIENIKPLKTIFYNDILGLPVVNLQNKLKVAVVQDVFFYNTQRLILGLIVQQKGILRSLKYIPLDDIYGLNVNNITIKDITCIKKVYKKDFEYKDIENLNKNEIGIGVYLENGTKIGEVRDIVLNLNTGTIEGYIISYGIIEDVISGRVLICNEKIHYMDNKIILLNASTNKNIIDKYLERSE